MKRSGSSRTLIDLLYGREDLLLRGEAVQSFLGKGQPAVDFHFEDSPVRGDEFGFNLESALDGVRQTGGAWLIVSNLAVLDGYLHG